ncbi:MAG: rhodanese-like domain-containing protein [Candidatus Peregrinibacteria bacterium]|nr:rhodanese-like domain-containing protein [Candidatus Peregrinibacteria bacterium]
MKIISIEDLEKRLKNPEQDDVFIDVRDEYEFDEERLEGFENIPLDEISHHLDAFKGKNVILFCRSGGRVEVAASLLERKGEQKEIWKCLESMIDWKRANKPTVKK